MWAASVWRRRPDGALLSPRCERSAAPHAAQRTRNAASEISADRHRPRVGNRAPPGSAAPHWFSECRLIAELLHQLVDLVVDAADGLFDLDGRVVRQVLIHV